MVFSHLIPLSKLRSYWSKPAGLPVEHVSGSKTAVYTGCFTNDWKDLYSKDPEYRLSHAITGLMPSIFANRLSWFFNFKGPSANIDTACSSSLVALDLACKGLANKDINMVCNYENITVSSYTFYYTNWYLILRPLLPQAIWYWPQTWCIS